MWDEILGCSFFSLLGFLPLPSLCEFVAFYFPPFFVFVSNSGVCVLCTLFHMNYVILYPSSSTFTLSPCLSLFHLFSQWLLLPLPHIRMVASAGLAIDVFQAKSSPIPIFLLLRLSLYHCSSLSFVNCSARL